jgi:hypothetical protein
VGETAPNAVLYGGWGRPMGEIEKAVAGYSQGDRKGKWLAIVKVIENAVMSYL